MLKFVKSFDFLANKEINDTCKINEQCNGTENANTCHFVEIENKGICNCNQHFEWIEGRCLEGKKYLYSGLISQNQNKVTRTAS